MMTHRRRVIDRPGEQRVELEPPPSAPPPEPAVIAPTDNRKYAETIALQVQPSTVVVNTQVFEAFLAEIIRTMQPSKVVIDNAGLYTTNIPDVVAFK